LQAGLLCRINQEEEEEEDDDDNDDDAEDEDYYTDNAHENIAVICID